LASENYSDLAIVKRYLHLAVFIQYWSVTDTHWQTDGQTHDNRIYRA